MLICFAWCLNDVFFQDREQEEEGSPPMGRVFGVFCFTRSDYSQRDSFIEERDSGRLIVPPPVMITKIQGDLLYCYREEKGDHQQFIVQQKNAGGDIVNVPFPDRIWIVLDTRQGVVRFFEDEDFRTEVEVDIRFE